MAAAPQEIFVEDDERAHVRYTPAGAWARIGGRPKLYRGGTYHQTAVPGANATFAFTGAFVSYYADYNSDHGNFTVSLDGAPLAALSSYSAGLRSQQLLFSAFVEPGPHALTITNGEGGRTVGVDYFVYHALAAASAASTSTGAITSTTTSTSEPALATSPTELAALSDGGSELISTTETEVAAGSGTPTATARSGGGGVHLSPAAAIGVALGATACAVLLLLCALALRERVRARRRVRMMREINALLTPCY